MNKFQEDIARMIYEGYTKAEIIAETTISITGYTRTIREIKEILGAKNLKEISIKYAENLEYRN